MNEPKYHDTEEVLAWIRRLLQKGFWGTIHLGAQGHVLTQVEPKPVYKPGDKLPDL